MAAEQRGVDAAEVQSILGRAEDGMVVEGFVIYMATHRMDIWAVGGTYKWEHGGGGGYGAGSLAAGVFFQGRWMLTHKDIYALDGKYDTDLTLISAPAQELLPNTPVPFS